MESFDLIIVEQAIIEMEDASKFYNAKVGDLGAKFTEEVFELLDKILLNPLLFPVNSSRFTKRFYFAFRL